MNLAERVSMKNKLIAASGLDAKEWQARATMEARAVGLEFNDWLALGQNINLETPLGGTSIFTDGGSTVQGESEVPSAQQEVAAASDEQGDKTITEDNKLSTQEKDQDTSSASEEQGDASQAENINAEEAASTTSESSGSEPAEIVDQASSLRQVAAEASAITESESGHAESTLSSEEVEESVLATVAAVTGEHALVSTNTTVESDESKQIVASSEAVKEQEAANTPTDTIKQHDDTTSQPETATITKKEADQATAVVTETAATDRTLEVIGKEKGGPTITEAANPVIGSGDMATQALFNKVAAATSQVGEETEASGDTYAEFIENHVSKLCQQARVSNIDLTSFGIRAQSLNFKNLKILSYGKHKFLGLPLNAKQEEALVFRLGLYCQQSPKEKLVIEAVTEVKDSTGFTFYSLLYTDSVVQKFVNATNFTVYINANDPDVSKLVMVVEKCSNKNSILS